MSKAIKVKKGVDIKLLGAAERKVSDAGKSRVYAIKPADYTGVIPKLAVKQGDEVKAGSTLFFDKNNPDVKIASPVSGEVAEIKRGAKRKILEVRVLADATNNYETFTPWNGGDRETLVKTMLDMGLWPFVIQRPYGVIANPADTPRDIYISGFDSAPLGADYSFLLNERKSDFQAGINALSALTSGKVMVGTRKGDTFYSQINGIETYTVSGPHPAGNVGVQIHSTTPINKGETIWTVNPMDVALIGKSLSEGKYRAERTIALAGSEVSAPQYYNTMVGADMKTVVEGKLSGENVRVISGNVLTGSNEGMEGSVGAYSHVISVIPEGDQRQFFLTKGWLGPGLSKFSISKAYPAWLMKNKKYRLDTNLNGEERAFVVTGELEKVFPFDIYPMQLIKAIMINDIDAMEKLGIYEVIPEDFALCEVVCTSKINIQEIVENGLLDLRKEFAS